jgi:sulfatase modifying factor 1
MISRILLTLSISLLSCNIVFAEQKVAVLAAVSTYGDARMNNKPLKYPEADATALRDVLVASGYKVTLLVGKSATRSAVLQALAGVQKQGDQDGVLILGFFGHGVQYGESAYFCPFDTNLRVVKDADNNILRFENGLPRQEPDPVSMVSMREMLDALALSPAGSKLLLADCCREDPNIARGGLQGRAFGSALRVDQLPKNCAAMFACSEGEQAYEHDDWKHGAFTKALLDSINTGQRVTANVLTDSVYSGVESLVSLKGEKQTVNSLFTGGRIDLKLRPGVASSPAMSRTNLPPPSSTGDALPRTITNSVGAKLVLITPGTFMMGSPESDTDAATDEKPQHSVTLTKSFYLGETEVTQGQWKKVMGTEPWKGQDFVREGENYPATYVSWNDAVSYCERLSELEGKTYRLPTEAEWEYACRGGTTTRYSFGDDASELPRYGWFNENADSVGEKYAHEVKQKLVNPFGLYDMHGNVFDWCSDWYGDYSSGSQTDPVGGSTSSYRVVRGGSWYDRASYCRSASRGGSVPSDRSGSLGFRLLLSPSVK